MSIFRSSTAARPASTSSATRKRWYLASGVILLICVLSFVFRGFNFGVEFAGGSQFQIQAQGTTITTRQAEDAFSDREPAVGRSRPGGRLRQHPADRGQDQERECRRPDRVLSAVAKSLGIPTAKISVKTVSSDWGHDVTVKAIQALIIFLIVVLDLHLHPLPVANGGRRHSSRCSTTWS